MAASPQTWAFGTPHHLEAGAFDAHHAAFAATPAASDPREHHRPLRRAGARAI
jgi:hypothetical protein